ncbi:PREDICTED: protein CREG1 [Chaetura pelagica]|uniref:protein CREG1 n=1 Tax=Chaetura pelagica TaxID=8897 RepID=UPI000523EBF5|nr:PREDICTED: protein CREG1 [Chaetura pelagica]
MNPALRGREPALCASINPAEPELPPDRGREVLRAAGPGQQHRLAAAGAAVPINSNASLTVSLAQTPYCKKHRYDPQNPLCAHIIFCGSIVKVNDSEAGIAKKALFSRHPEMESWPKDHNWFFAKFNITNIWVLDYFGGLKIVTPEEYYSVKP